MKRVFITGASGFIGTNLVFELRKMGCSILNFDSAKPFVREHEEHWIEGDILDADQLAAALRDYSPDWVLHLAARTDCDENTTVEDDYQINTTGTANLLAAVEACETVERLMITSSQYVCGPGDPPNSDDDYFPHTVYGHSKVETERLTRAAPLDCTWFMIRPTNIWGPYHDRYRREFWKIVSMGLYLHPDLPAPTRTYGYVGNIVWQMLKLLESPAEDVHRKVFYVGDRPIQIDRWSLGFQKALKGRDAPRIPGWAMKGIALVGDGISKVIGRPFFLTSSRLNSMTQDYIAPMDSTFDYLGDPPYTLEEGIEETSKWFLESKRDEA